jgi:hypothetical protein
MFKKIVITLTLSLFLFTGVAVANEHDRSRIVELDERTFVIVNYMDENTDTVDAVLSLFKVKNDQLMLLDEVHYKGAEPLSMRTNVNQSVLKHIKTLN